VYRKLLVAALALGLTLLTARFLFTPPEHLQTPGREIVFIQDGTPTPLRVARSPLAELQGVLDAVSKAALDEDWPAASRSLRELQRLWAELMPGANGSLQTGREMEQLLQSLQQAVWGQEQQRVLEAAQELTRIMGKMGT